MKKVIKPLKKINKIIKKGKLDKIYFYDGHDFDCLYGLVFRVDNYYYSFSTVLEGLAKWEEVGYLSVEESDSLSLSGADISEISLSEFVIDKVSSIVYEDEELYVSYGVRFLSLSGDVLLLAAGISPGSLTMKISGYENKYNPMFYEEKSKIVPCS